MTSETASAPAAAGNGMATTSMVLGIVGAAFGLIPLLGFLALILGVLAVVFGFLGRGRVRRGVSAAGKGQATAGLILGIVAIGLGIWGLVLVDQFFSELENL